MLKRLTSWQIVVSQVSVGLAAPALLALIIHFPDVTHRPMPPPGKLFFALIILITVSIISLGGIGVQSLRARTDATIISTILVWLLASYGLLFVWVNTYGE